MLRADQPAPGARGDDGYLVDGIVVGYPVCDRPLVEDPHAGARVTLGLKVHAALQEERDHRVGVHLVDGPVHDPGKARDLIPSSSQSLRRASDRQHA